MILGRTGAVPATELPSGGVTLDQILRRNAREHADQLALLDPPDRIQWADGQPRSLTWAALDAAVERLAACFQAIGLPTDAVIALQLPNIHEHVVVVLAAQRAGLIVAPMPLVWRRAEAVAALGKIGARALITASQTGNDKQALLARDIAAECFSIRFVAAFGPETPDGVVALDPLLAGADMLELTQVTRANAAEHVALLTFEAEAEGTRAIARNHRQLLAAGIAVMLEAGLSTGATILTAYPPTSLAGMACGLLPWLLSGGTLMLHQAFDGERLLRQLAIQPTLVALPGPLVGAELSATLHEQGIGIAAIWRAPERATRAERCALAAHKIVDIRAFGELGLIVSRRGSDGRIMPIPAGLIRAPRGASEAPPIIETHRLSNGTLGLRGAMVQMQVFPPTSVRGGIPLSDDADGWADTGYLCRANTEQVTLEIDAPPAGLVQVGGLRMFQPALDEWSRQAGKEVEIAAFPDLILGNRIVGSAPNRESAHKIIEDAGAPALIALALRGRRAERREQAA